MFASEFSVWGNGVSLYLFAFVYCWSYNSKFLLRLITAIDLYRNPCLTFVTPTLLAGDRSLADVVAHEAAHSWSGNLVTNETWEHFWLNEGWTIFLQRKIMTKIHGDDKFFDFDGEFALSGLR